MVEIQLFNDITENTLPRFTNALKDAPEGDEVVIQICSAGGYVFCAFGIIDYLKAHHFKTTAEIYGYAASAAALVALSCDKVKMAEYGSIMLHSAYTDEGIVDAGVKRANALQVELIKKRNSDLSIKTLETDRWISSKEALSLGLCDEIINCSSSIKSFCKSYLAFYSTSTVSQEDTMEKEERKPCAAEVEEVKEEPKAEEAAPSFEDVVERLVERLDEIEHRLAVLEGEGKKADDIAEDEAIAKRKALYARLSAPVKAPSNKPKAKASKLDAQTFASFLN